MNFDLQPTLIGKLVKAEPLYETDFERLYQAASDPLIWEQHPNKDRYKKEVFQNFFKGAIESGGAFIVTELATGEVIGSSRFYDLDESNSEVAIGYTFIGRKFWGGGFNRELKKLMLDHAFLYTKRVVFHIGAENMRSRKAIEKLGATLVKQVDVAYYGEPVKPNVEYQILQSDWSLISTRFFDV